MNETRRRGGYFIPVVLVIGLVIAVTSVFPFRRIIEQNRQVEGARTELAALRVENERLALETEALKTPSEVERLARENFGYVRPGDTSYVVVEPVGLAAADDPQPEPQDEIESAGLLHAIWDFLTGRDLAAGG